MSCSSAEELWGSGDNVELETEYDSDSDLGDLYESFNFEGDVDSQLSQIQSAEDPVPHAVMPRGVNNHPLYPDSQLSSFQSLLLVFQYAIRHSLTKKAFTELLQLLSVHLPPGAKSVHSLKQVFVEAFPEAKAEQHLYCSCCQRLIPLGAPSCVGDGCSGSPPAVFITLPVGPQLKRMMEGTLYIRVHVVEAYICQMWCVCVGVCVGVCVCASVSVCVCVLLSVLCSLYYFFLN